VKVEVFGPISQSVQDGEGLKVNAVKRAAPFKVTQDDVEHISNLFFCGRIRKCFRKASLI